MKNLDAINPLFAKPQTFVAIEAILPFLMGLGGLSFAYNAAPSIQLLQNPLSVFSLCVLLFGVLMAPIPWLFKWGWQAKYFGVTSFYIASPTFARTQSQVYVRQIDQVRKTQCKASPTPGILGNVRDR